MRSLSLAVLALAALLTPILALGHRPGDPPHQVHRMGDLKLESDEVIRDFAISRTSAVDRISVVARVAAEPDRMIGVL